MNLPLSSEDSITLGEDAVAYGNYRKSRDSRQSRINTLLSERLTVVMKWILLVSKIGCGVLLMNALIWAIQMNKGYPGQIILGIAVLSWLGISICIFASFIEMRSRAAVGTLVPEAEEPEREDPSRSQICRKCRGHINLAGDWTCSICKFQNKATEVWHACKKCKKPPKAFLCGQCVDSVYPIAKDCEPVVGDNGIVSVAEWSPRMEERPARLLTEHQVALLAGKNHQKFTEILERNVPGEMELWYLEREQREEAEALKIRSEQKKNRELIERARNQLNDVKKDPIQEAMERAEQSVLGSRSTEGNSLRERIEAGYREKGFEGEQLEELVEVALKHFEQAKDHQDR